MKILSLQSLNLQKFFSITRTIFYSRSEQFEKQNTRTFDEFWLEKQVTLPNRSMSVSAGMPVLAVENLRTVLTKERVPHMDHYRHSIDHRKTFFSNITDYGHPKAKSLILCGPNSNLNPKWIWKHSFLKK